jgi:cation:H+ antiporter
MPIAFLLLVIGMLLLIKGAGWLVDGASAVARHYRIPDLTIGLTIVAFGTSAPELVVNAVAAWQGHQDIVFGNIIGSNNFNLFIILGVAGVIAPLTVQSGTVWREIPLSLGAAVILFLLVNDALWGGTGTLSRMDGILLLALFAAFLLYVARQLRPQPGRTEPAGSHTLPLKSWGLIVIGLAGLIAGGRMVVTHAVQIASLLGVSERIIGLTIVAAGTSMPELATSVVAAIKKNNDIAVGNIIGSNLFNILFILGTSSLIRPVPYDKAFNTGLYVMAAGTVLLFLAMFTGQKKKLERWEAGMLLLCYIAYLLFSL